MSDSKKPEKGVFGQSPDVRYLGRLLGDVIRRVGGEALYRRIHTRYDRCADTFMSATATAIAATFIIWLPQ